MTYFLNVTLSKDRDKVGAYAFSNGLVNLRAGSVLGRSDNAAAKLHHNPTRDPLLPFGDIPTGSYIATVIPASTDHHAYGPYARFYFTAREGNAVKANRSGLEGHGGDLNPLYKQWGGLRPTNGCLRFFNEDIRYMTTIVNGLELHVVNLLIMELD